MVDIQKYGVQHIGEIYTPNTKIDANGIDISNTSNNSKFVASKEKVGVYKNQEVIFDVNNETTTMKNLIVRDVEGSIVQIGKIENAANYEETSILDNTSSAQVIVGITTGPKFEMLFKVELAMSVVIILLLLLDIKQVSIIRKKK